MRLRFGLSASVAILVLASCGSSQQAQPAAAHTSSLEARSSISCQSEAECAVCYRAGSCGDPIAANDPHAGAPECHVSPAAFCMPRRARCEDQRCTAH